MSELIHRRTSLSENIVGLARHLRREGFLIASDEECDAMQALRCIPPTSESIYKYILRACFAKNNYQFRLFEQFYNDYIYELGKAVDSKEKKVPESTSNSVKPKTPSLESLKSWLYNNHYDDPEIKASYSDAEVLATKDFSSMTPDEIELIGRLLEHLSHKILRRKSRLKRISKKQKKLDLRLTIRKNLRSGSELNHVIYSSNKTKILKLVLLCDVSKSMDLYSKFFIQFMYAFHSSTDRIRTYVFSTALHDVSEVLQNYSYSDALEKMSQRIPQWSGGTKIGDCLGQFLDDYGHVTLDKKTIVLILSDGWDTGSPEGLGNAMHKLRSLCRKILWLNPLAGHPGFIPESIGMQVVTPYVHRMYAAHNLKSLKKVVENI